MTLYQTEYNQRVCRCHAHQQHRLYRYLWNHPGATLVFAAHDLQLTYSNAKQLSHRLRLRCMLNRCPECFGEGFFRGVCTGCGYELTNPSPLETSFDRQSPAISIHAGGGLGSVTNYRGIGFENHHMIIQRRAESSIDAPLVRGCKSDVLNWLKYSFPEDSISDVAGRLVMKEILELQSRYPLLTSSKYVRKQVVGNVISRLCLIYPKLRNGDKVTSGVLESRDR